jgi:hypothetical protein
MGLGYGRPTKLLQLPVAIWPGHIAKINLFVREHYADLC